jgi:hypothetical protein
MTLLRTPERPRALPFVHVHLDLGAGMPELWKSWVWN